MPTATKAAHNGAAATAAPVTPVTPVAETVAAAFAQTSTLAGDLVTRTTEVVTPLVQAAAGSGRALSDGLAAQAKTVALLTVDVYQQAVRRQLDRSIVLTDAVPVGGGSPGVGSESDLTLPDVIIAKTGVTDHVVGQFRYRRHQGVRTPANPATRDHGPWLARYPAGRVRRSPGRPAGRRCGRRSGCGVAPGNMTCR